MRLITLAGILVGALLLSGCTPATIAAIASQDALELHDAAKQAISRKVQARNEIWTRCRDLLFDEVDALKAVGDFAGARALLYRSWPKLQSVEIMKGVLGKDTDLSRFDTAILCSQAG